MHVWRYRTAKEPHLHPALITSDGDRDRVWERLTQRYVLDGGIVELTHDRETESD